MALDAASMATRILSKVAAIPPVQDSDPAASQAYRDAVMVAFCNGIIEEITTSAVVTTTSGAPDGEHTGNVS